MADMGRSGCRKLGSSMPWPGCLPATAVTHASAIVASSAPPRSRTRRSDSSRAKRHVRIWPSAVSRTRSHDPQKGCVTEAMTPTLWSVPDHPEQLGGGAPPGRGVAGVDDERELGPQPGQGLRRP